jgi:hypothetical protein
MGSSKHNVRPSSSGNPLTLHQSWLASTVIAWLFHYLGRRELLVLLQWMYHTEIPTSSRTTMGGES